MEGVALRCGQEDGVTGERTRLMGVRSSLDNLRWQDGGWYGAVVRGCGVVWCDEKQLGQPAKAAVRAGLWCGAVLCCVVGCALWCLVLCNGTLCRGAAIGLLLKGSGGAVNRGWGAYMGVNPGA